jgi:ZIP family zinc transporter
MTQAIIYSALAGSSLIIGAILATKLKISRRITASIMAFGSGVLICAVTFGLMEEAFNLGGFDAVILGFLSGGLVFIAGDWWLHKIGARRHKKIQIIHGEDQNGKLISLGAVLDGVPESIALGITLFAGQGKGILLASAIFLSNLPESMSAVPGLRKEGFSKQKIYWLWFGVGLASVFFTLLSYLFLRDIDPNITGFLESFAAGAILAMLADSMIPEAFAEGGFGIAIMTILGFLTAFIISKV